MNLAVVEAIALYSTYAENRDTIACFLDFHETRLLQKNIHKPEIDFLESK